MQGLIFLLGPTGVLGSPSYPEASQRLGDTLRAAGGYARAVDEIFAFTGR